MAALKESWGKIRALLQGRRLDAALVLSPVLTRYAIGAFRSIDFYSPWGPGPVVGLVPSSGTVIGFTPDDETSDAPGLEWRSYGTYSWRQHSEPIARVSRLVIDELTQRGLANASIGIELRAITADLERKLVTGLPAARFVDLSTPLVELTAIKTEPELGLIRAAVEASVVGQAAARSNVCAGLTEVEALALIRSAIEDHVGARLNGFVADLLSGSRTVSPGMPSRRRIETGDVVICDLVVSVDGYWGDTAATFALGSPSKELRRVHALVLQALERARAMVRPGISAKELDDGVRSYLAGYGYECRHHIGHGIGLTYHEEPLIGPKSETVLQPGMVIALEPGVYVAGEFGVRLEDTVVVTDHGCEALSNHIKSPIEL